MRFRQAFAVVMVWMSVAPLVGCQRRFDPFLVSVDWAERQESSTKVDVTVQPVLPEEGRPDQKGRFTALYDVPPQVKKNEESTETTMATPLPGLPPELAGRFGRLLERLGALRDNTSLVEQNLRTLKPVDLTPTSESGRAPVRDLQALDELVGLLEKQLSEISTDLAAVKEGQRVHREVVDERLRQLENRLEALERTLQGRAEPTNKVTLTGGTVVGTSPPTTAQVLVPNAGAPATVFTVTFACGATQAAIIPAGGGLLPCPVHGNLVLVKP
jgi:hypothetical protein